jgi:hypothetical protein
MRITIDTKQDSRDEIRKVIKLLNDIVGNLDKPPSETQNYSSYQQNEVNNSAQNQEGFFNMFDGSATPSEPLPSSSSSLDEEPKKDEELKKDKEADFEIYEY